MVNDFNPRSPHGERHVMPRNLATIPEISIHAPRTGSDDVVPGIQLRDIHFNPRSPHGERPCLRRQNAVEDNFNPRSPHGERQAHKKHATSAKYFNPRSPHGERRPGK